MSGLCVLLQKETDPLDKQLFRHMEGALSQWGEVLREWQCEKVAMAQVSWKEQRISLYEQDDLTSRYAVVADASFYYTQEVQQALAQRNENLSSSELHERDLILWAYHTWGEQCVDHLEGDYSFVVWDERQRKVFAARSPMGLRALYFHQSPTQWTIASDPNILLVNPAVARELDPTWLSVFLTTGKYCHGALFRDIQELQAGCTLVITPETSEVRTFWTPSPRARVSYSTQQEYIERFRCVVEASVRERVSHDQPTLVEVSGGLDSSTIASFARAVWDARLHGFHFSSAAFSEKNERHFAEAVASLHTIPMWYTSEADAPLLSSPFASPSWMGGPHTALFFFDGYYQRIQECASAVHARVLLRGTFGDQLFLPATYRYLGTTLRERHYRLLLQELWSLVRYGHSLRTAVREGVLVPSRTQKSNDIAVPWVRTRTASLAEAFSVDQQDHLRQMCPHPFYRELFRWMKAYTEYVSLSTALTLQYGLEVRDPYADLRIIELLLSFPPSAQIRAGCKKFLLREATRGVLPECVRTRTTKGRIARVMVAGLCTRADELHALIQNMPAFLDDYIDKAQLTQAFRHAVMGGPIHQPSLLSALGLVVWSHRLPWADGAFPQPFPSPSVIDAETSYRIQERFQ